MTRWQYDFGEELRTQRGESGRVIARTEARADKSGIVTQSFQIERRDDRWNEVVKVWVPAHALMRK